MYLRQLYLSSTEVRHEMRGTELGKHKDRVTTVLAGNANGSHVLPALSIGSTKNPRFLRTVDYESQKMRYRFQKNGWMDSEGFLDWINWWYGEVCKKTDGPWLLIMDDCSGHESDISLLGLRIELLPPRTTAKYQTLDLGLIAHSKMRYRSLLLRITIDVMLRKHAKKLNFLIMPTRYFRIASWISPNHRGCYGTF